MSVDWVTIEPATRVALRRGKFNLSAATLSTTWAGASEVLAQYNFAASKNFIINSVPAKPTNATYMLCIRFREDEVVTRYRLWDDANFISQVEKYNGQAIKKNFSLEVWSISGQAAISLEATELVSGITLLPTDYRDSSNYSDATAVEATPVAISDVVSDYEALPVTAHEHYRAADRDWETM